MKASELIVRCLENEGVRYVFGLPGEEILDILDSLADSSIAVSGDGGFEAARELKPILAEALAFPGPSIIDVPVDYSENARLTAKLGHIVCPI